MAIPQLISDEAYKQELQINDRLLERERTVKDDVVRLRTLIANGDYADDKTATTEHILAGGTLSSASDLKSQLSDAMLNWRAIDDARNSQSGRIALAKANASLKIRAKIKPEHGRLMTRLCAALIDTHTAWAALYSMERELIDKDIGMIGVCEISPLQLLDVPTDRESGFAYFFRDAVKAGYLKSVPKEFA